MLLPRRAPSFRVYSAVVIITLVLIFFLHDSALRLRIPKTINFLSLPSKAPPGGSLIPEKIWYKLGPRGQSDESREWVDTCLKNNPTYESEFMTDSSGDEYVRKNFGSRPDVVQTYLALPFPILKADLLRYLLLFAEGGIWSDLDVSCEDVPIRDWIPEQYRESAALVVGWEFDMGWGLGWGDGFIRQFATWTVMAAPGSRHLLMVIDDIVKEVRGRAEKNNCTIEELTLAMIGDVVDLTGPRRMTTGIIKSLNISDQGLQDGKSPSFPEPRLIEDVLILPGYSFANSTNRYKPEMVITGPALVTHHYAGSWKNEHGGEMADP